MNIKKLMGDFRLPFVLLLLMVVLTFISPRFLTVANLSNVLWSICVTVILASGAIYAPLTGGIDLSLGSAAALAGIVVNSFMNKYGFHWIPSIFFTIAIGACIGAFNGFVLTRFKIPAFIVTMAAKTYLYGVALAVSNGAMLAILEPAAFIAIGNGRTFGLPNPIFIMIFCIIASHVVLRYTVFGRQVIAVGANEVAARLSGVDPTKTRIIAFTISGSTAAIAGIVLASLTQQIFATAAVGIELEVMTAIVVGGTHMRGGKGSVIGAFIGAFMVAIIINGMNLLDAPAPFHPIVTGIVILVALILNQGINFKKIRPKRL